jgi:uncharacterized protein (DUF58 family)
VKPREVPLPLPTARLAKLAAATALLVAAGAVVPAVAWIGFAALGALLVAAVVDWAALPHADAFRVERVERTVLSHGAVEPVAVDVRLSRGRVTARGAEDLPHGLDRVADPAAADVADAPTRFVTSVRAAKRGTHALTAFHLRWKSRWGLAERQAAFELPATLRVYPGVRAVAQATRFLLRGRREESGLRRARRRGEGTSFESLREHVRGEDPRFVDWKATAKRAKLIARHYEVERDQSVMLLVDCGRWMTAEVGGATRLDRVLEACVLLAKVAVSRGDRVGLLAFADEVLAFAPPAKGRAAVDAVVAATFEIQPRLVESDYAGAFAHLAARRRKRSILVLFTDVMSRDASRAVVAECVRSARRHLPLAVTLRDVDLHRRAASVPADAAAAYRQAAAEELLLEREQALAAMRGAGVHVVDVEPARLSPAVIDRYLEVKERLLA